MKRIPIRVISYGFVRSVTVLLVVLICRPALADIVINELLAFNRLTSVDNDGKASDWVELFNAGTDPIDLGGYALTDGQDKPLRWKLPQRTLAPEAFLLVWCSGNDRARRVAEVPDSSDATARFVHSDFKLDRRGESLFLFAPDGRIADRVTFPEQVADQSYGRSPDGSGRFLYHITPSPGAPNEGRTAVVPLVVGDLHFSVRRGFFRKPVDVEISTSTPDAEIRYTRDGSAPTRGTGTVYTRPVHVRGTTVLRAVAYKKDLAPTAVSTQTYLFVDEVIGQNSLSVQRKGLPSRWGHRSADYGMDELAEMLPRATGRLSPCRTHFWPCRRSRSWPRVTTFLAAGASTRIRSSVVWTGRVQHQQN
jgi:hypothetical protein